jgi:hypothetical protein
MTDVLVYWKDYQPKTARGACLHWHSNHRMFGDLLPGDRLWVVTSGKSLGHEDENAGYLVALWPVAHVMQNPGDIPRIRPENSSTGCSSMRSKPCILTGLSALITSSDVICTIKTGRSVDFCAAHVDYPRRKSVNCGVQPGQTWHTSGLLATNRRQATTATLSHMKGTHHDHTHTVATGCHATR